MVQVSSQPTFWADLRGESPRHRLEVAVILGVIAWCWYSTIEGTAFYNRKPDFTWMVFACTACFIMLKLARRGRLEELVKEAFGSAVIRRELASLIIQLRLILAGNTVEIGLLIFQGVEWHPTDTINVICVLVGMSLFLLFALLRKLGRPRKWLPFLNALQWKKPWAKCWYTVNLKAAEQVVQIFSALLGYTHPDMGFVSLLLILGMYRVKNAVTGSGWKKPLSISTLIDALTLVGLAATIAHLTWPQLWPAVVDALVVLWGVLR